MELPQLLDCNKTKILLSVLVVLGLAMLYFLDPVQHILMPKCPFKMLTGYDCGGCGFQRCVHALLHGDIVTAFRYNLFLVYALPYTAVIAVNKYLMKGDTSNRISLILEGKAMVWLYVALFLGWTVIRNIIDL